MPPSFAPAPFYGDNQVTLDAIRRIRFSRLFDSESTRKSPDEKSRKSTSTNVKPQFKGVKLFSNVSHGVRKAKLKKKKPIKEMKLMKDVKTKPGVSIREKMRDKFDFSRTPYSLCVKKPRVTLNEEDGKKRKFFKTTVETPEAKKPVVENNVAEFEFEDLNGTEEEPFAEIKKGVSIILHQIGWFDDDNCIKPQITRKVADESLNPVFTPNKSYITLANLSPRTPEIKDLNPNDHRNSPATPMHQNTPTPASQMNISTPNLTPQTFATSPTTLQPNSKADESMKLYPLFTPTGSKKVLSDVTNKTKKQRHVLNKAAAPNDQYQIDAGQKVIGPKECVSCGMVFDIGDPFDKQRHETYHNKRKEVKFKGSKSDNVVGLCGTDRIILIKHSDDMKKRRKVEEILKITEEEIGQGYAFESSFMAFLYVRNETVLGCLIAEPNVLASRIIHSDGIVLLSDDRKKVKCGVNRVWVQSEFRGNNIATELMNCLRKNFVFGEILDVDDLAFSSTTPAGDAFAIKYCKRDDYLSYIGSYVESF